MLCEGIWLAGALEVENRHLNFSSSITSQERRGDEMDKWANIWVNQFAKFIFVSRRNKYFSVSSQIKKPDHHYWPLHEKAGRHGNRRGGVISKCTVVWCGQPQSTATDPSAITWLFHSSKAGHILLLTSDCVVYIVINVWDVNIRDKQSRSLFGFLTWQWDQWKNGLNKYQTFLIIYETDSSKDRMQQKCFLSGMIRILHCVQSLFFLRFYKDFRTRLCEFREFSIMSLTCWLHMVPW